MVSTKMPSISWLTSVTDFSDFDFISRMAPQLPLLLLDRDIPFQRYRIYLISNISDIEFLTAEYRLFQKDSVAKVALKMPVTRRTDCRVVGYYFSPIGRSIKSQQTSLNLHSVVQSLYLSDRNLLK